MYTTKLGPLPKVPRVVVEEIVVDIMGDRWVKFADCPFYKNADQEDDRLTRHDLADRYGPLSPYTPQP